METQKGDELLCFHPHFDVRHKQDDKVVSSRRRPHFTPKKIPRYALCYRLREPRTTECGQKDYVI